MIIFVVFTAVSVDNITIVNLCFTGLVIRSFWWVG